MQFPYRVFEVVSHIWRRRPKELQTAPTEFFKVKILKLPKKGRSIRDTLCRGWRDFRLAIEECWKALPTEDFMPYAITAAFIRNKDRPKTAAERVMDEREMLSRN